MGSSTGGGGTGGSGREPKRDPYAIAGKTAAGRREDTRKREEERLERAAFVSGEESYVKGGAGETTVRDSSGRGVLTSTGVERQVASQQEELERVISQRTGGQGDPEVEKRNMAIEQLEKRKENLLPGTLGMIARINIENQIKQLQAGGTAQFSMTDAGEFVAKGVIPKGQEGQGISPNIISGLEQQAAREPREATTIITPEVTPEVTPEADAVMLGGASETRRRRSTRAGGAGTLLEGGGVLYE